MIITSAGIGPFTSDQDREAARRLLGIAREVHVRDRLALEALTDLDVKGPVSRRPFGDGFQVRLARFQLLVSHSQSQPPETAVRRCGP